MNRRFLDCGVRIVAAAALLLAVLSSPILSTRTSRKVPSNYLPRNFAILDTWRSGQFAPSVPPSSREEDSFDSDIEEELDADIEDEPTTTSPPAPASLEVLPSPCPEAYSDLLGLAVALAARPLRC
jgi:hypothetical protein